MRNYESAEEDELLGWAQEGDGTAFGCLVRPYRRMIEVICQRITGNRDDALDAYQETLLRAWKAITRFEGRSKLSVWLYAIATSAAIGVVRKPHPEPVGVIPEHRAVNLRDPATATCDRSAVDGALAQLPPQFRAAIVLREYADLTYEDIAATLGVPVNTVKSQISRARQALRELLLEAES